MGTESSETRYGTFRGHSHDSYEGSRQRHVSSGQRSTSRRRASRGGNDVEQGVAKPAVLSRTVDASSKLGTFSGVFVPTVLNVLSILLFLRFGMILGQAGLLGMMAMLILSYAMNLITTLSVSAIATNGTVRGGGAYYLISRSLGPEFGGSIGIVFYLGFVFNTGMNAVGLVDCFKQAFGAKTGTWASWMPEGPGWQYLGGTIVLVACTAVCLAGSSAFARASNGLLVVLLLSVFSIPVSSVFVHPFKDALLQVNFTGYRWETFRQNMFPRFTKGAAGSVLPGRENFQDLFGILYPATAGILAGASMSGDLKHPSKAIPKGTLYGLGLTFFSYAIVILALAGTVSRESFYSDLNIVQDTNLSGILVLLGECATSIFSVLMGVIGSAKLLQALARDDLLPGCKILGQGTAKNDEPTVATCITYLVAQLTILFDINVIASLVSMAFLLTFMITNLACFLLKIGSAPNFRPSFRYFSWQTAAFGTLVNAAAMFFVDGVYATGCVAVLIILFLMIHYTTPPKSWGDVSQSLIYHQVRKYLLRLRQEHVKFWRPQILLLVNDPRRQFKLIQFCNALKKGALFVLGHVIVSDDFAAAVPEARSQQTAWKKYIDFSKIKAFVNICISPSLEWGTRNVALSAGLGGMRPNIAIMGAYNLALYHRISSNGNTSGERPGIGQLRRSSSNANKSQSRRDSEADKMSGDLPTDANRPERDITPTSYVTILEDLILRLQLNVAIARGFRDLKSPPKKSKEGKSRNIDLWPIMMSAEIRTHENGEKRSVLTTNFDTYTLILQLGCILNTVDDWKRTHTLRVAVFVEYESDVEEERSRVEVLLASLRIKAEVLVFWLACGSIKTYEVLVNGAYQKFPGAELSIDGALKDDEWWHGVQVRRGRRAQPDLQVPESAEDAAASFGRTSSTLALSQSAGQSSGFHFGSLRRFLHSSGRERSASNLASLRGRLSMTTTRLQDDLLSQHAAVASASEESDSSSSFEDEASLTGGADAALESDDAQPLLTTASADRQRDPALSRPRLELPPDEPPGASVAASDTSGTASPDERAKAAGAGGAPARLPRPRPSRRPSGNKFSSLPVPRTAVAADDGPGPSIMFAEPAEGPSAAAAAAGRRQSIYDRREAASPASPPLLPPPPSASAAGAARGGPGLSFNDLPGRAQHLVLNELMRAHSGRGDTAVVFTTLPGPAEGTGATEEDSVAYLSDLEVLCDGLPPVLLVHSNSMTVTTNL